MMTAEKVATYGIRERLREVKRVCENESKAVLTTIVAVIVLARECVEMKRRNVTMSSKQTDLKTKLVEIQAA